MILSIIGFIVLLVAGVLIGIVGLQICLFQMATTNKPGLEAVICLVIGVALMASAVHLAPFTVTIST